MGKFCYLSDIISYYGGASEAVSARVGSAWKKFRELIGVLVGKQGLCLKQRGKFISVVLDPIADEPTFCGVERRMIWDDVLGETG